MKQIFVGSEKRAKLFTKINKIVRIPHIVQAVIAMLLVVIPIVGAKRIFNYGGKMSPVAYISTVRGSGSGVLVSNNHILTAAHVVYGMSDVDLCKVDFYDPQNPDAIPVHAVARLKAMGNYNPNDIISDQDFALLELVNANSNNFSTPYTLGNSATVKINDAVHAIGFPATSIGFTSFSSMESKPGEINNLNGGWLKNDNLFVANCEITHGYSGGALEDNNGKLIGIILGSCTDPKNPSYQQYFYLKINVPKKALSAYLY